MVMQCQERRAPDYFPLAVGHRWTYTVDEGGDFGEAELEVVESDGGQFTLRQSALTEEVWLEFPFWPSADVHVTRTDSEVVCPDGEVYRLLKLPLEVGAGWVHGPDSAFALDKVPVSVPAGDFEDCYRVAYRFTSLNGHEFLYIWYAPDIGIVRIDDLFGGVTAELHAVNF
jgi:hypothetical protein